MKLLTLCIAALAAASAQDLTGQWQGLLKGPREARIVMKVSTAAAGLAVTVYNIDQSGEPVPTNQVTLQGGVLRFVVPSLNATYEGRLNAASNSITGMLNLGQPRELNLDRTTAETAWAIPEPPKAMAADARLVFEVATIKPNQSGQTARGAGFQARTFTIRNYTLNDMITFAYNIHPRQVTNLPAWGESERFDIQAQPLAEGQPTGPQLKTMLQALLAERFQLVFHRDTKEVNVYAITVGPNGHKMAPSTSREQLPNVAFRGMGNLPASNVTMKEFANAMQNSVLDRPVIDKTGLDGRFDFSLRWTPDEFQFPNAANRPPAPTNDPSAPPDLFRAMQEQLGLKTEATKLPTDVFVIDKAAKPSEN